MNNKIYLTINTTTITKMDIIRDIITQDTIIIGVDEAGRGPLFGDVYTGAIILPPEEYDFDRTCLKDSKKFTSKKKINEVFEYIKENTYYYDINYSNHEEIDKYNILQATQRSMHRAVFNVITKLINYLKENDMFDLSLFEKIRIMVDGNYFNTFKYFYEDSFYIIKHQCLIKGDSLCKEISAASILAKVGRDMYIDNFVEENPEYDEKYGLLKNKGYATKIHINGIKEHGYSPYHRKSFKLKNI